MPAAAQRCLLSQLAKARAQLCYHRDFDWPGVRIGNHVMREHGAQSWRFGAADYEAAVEGTSCLGQALTGAVLVVADDGSSAGKHEQAQVDVILLGKALGNSAIIVTAQVGLRSYLVPLV